MKPLSYLRAGSVAEATMLAGRDGHRLLGGGTNLVDLMRKGVEQPDTLVDVTTLSQDISETADGGLMIGAAVRNTALAAHPLVRTRYPVLSRAILSGASGQIRNMATVAGNLLQRSRCAYFNDVAGSRCNKRIPGSGCDARGGFTRYSAVIGGSESCISVHPSDMCVALVALDAQVLVAGPDGDRMVPLSDFYLLPGDTPARETVLAPGEVITGVTLPPAPVAALSDYRKVRDRASYAFALVSVAACATLRDGVLAEVRLAFGGIAPKPWRALRAEDALRGGPVTPEAVAAAMARELEDAAPLPGNAFKLDLAQRTAFAVLAGLKGERA